MAKIENSNSNTIISGTSGNDSIYNGSGGEISGFRTGSNVTINGGEGNDYIFTNSGGTNILINGGDGNDTVYNFYCHEITINGGYDNDSIATFTEAEINGDAGNDTLVCEEFDCTAKGGADSDVFVYRNSNRVDESYANFFITDYAEEDIVLIETTNISDISTTRSGNVVFQIVGNGSIILENASDKVITYIDNSGSKKTFRQVSKLITLTEGNDTYSNTVEGATIQALGGKDSIYNDASNVSIDAGAGNDYIENNVDAEYVSINGGTGNDTIYGGNGNNVLTGGKGSDIFVHSSGNYVIKDYSSEDIIRFASGAFNFHTEGNDLIFDVDEGEILVKGGTSETITFINQFGYKFVNFVSHMLLTGTSGNDYIYNNSNSNDSSILGNAGDDKLKNRGSNVMISGGDGKDIIYNEGSNVTIIGGKGSDTIYNEYGSYGENVLFKYASGDGNDIIYGFMSDSTLSISGGSYSTTKSGSNIIVTVGDGKISLMGAASLSSVHIDGEETTIETNSWKLSGTTATYGTSDKTLATVKGVKSLDGLSLNNKVVTIAKTSLGTANVSISGDGYKLALADDVKKSATTKKSWSMKDSATATYKQTKSAYYTLSNNKITYKKSSSSTLATVSGVKSTDGLKVSGKTVTVSNASLNKKAVTISDGYTLKLGSDVTKSTSTAAKWTLSNSTATYKSAKKTTGYKLASNKISYVTAGGGKILAKISGVKSKPTLSDGVITLKTSNIGEAKKVSVSGNYTFNFAAGDYKNASVSGTANADTIVSNGTNLFISGGKGNDSLVSNETGGNVFVYNSGDGNDVITNFAATDKLSIKSAATYSVSGSDVIFSVGTGSITVKDAKDKTFTYYVDGDEKIYSNVTLKPYTIKGKGVSLTSAYVDDEFDVSTVKSGSSIVTINGSKVSHALKITGNAKANKIIGTGNNDKIYGGSGKDSINGGSGNDTLRGDSGNDTLTGGKGSDVFIYYEGNGNDVITDYAAEDTIIIDSDSAVTAAKKYSDVVLTVGNGSVTLRDAHQDKIGVTYFENGVEHDFINGKQAVTFEGTEQVRITARYWKSSFDAANFDNRRNIDGSAVTHNIKITGNKLANKIIGGSGKNTLIGGAGNDTLQGGDKADVFVYGKGDGNDIIYDYGAGDIISIKSGAATVGVKGDTVILTVGNGKISVDGAAGKTVTYYDDNGRTSKIFSANDDMWFLDDENYIGADNQLSSIVQTHGAAFTTNLVPNSSFPVPTTLPALTYSAKK